MIIGTKNNLNTIIIEVAENIPTIIESIILLPLDADPITVEEINISPIKSILLYQKISVSLFLFQMEINNFVDNEPLYLC